MQIGRLDIRYFVRSAKHGRNLEAIALVRAWPDSRCSTRVDQWNRQPEVGVVAMLKKRRKLSTIIGQALQGSYADIEHVHRAVIGNDEGVAEAVNQPKRETGREWRRPIAQDQASVLAGLINEVIVDVHNLNRECEPSGSRVDLLVGSQPTRTLSVVTSVS